MQTREFINKFAWGEVLKVVPVAVAPHPTMMMAQSTVDEIEAAIAIVE